MPYTQDGIGYQKTDTSRAAARSNYPGKLTARDRVLQLLQKVPLSMSSHEIADVLRIPEVTVRPRLSELKNDNKIVDSGERGETPWGKKCIKWRSV
jgi:predicted HTH transcriptional regulator